MSDGTGEKILDLQGASEITQDYKLLQARNSKPFIATMVDICSALNACPLGKMRKMNTDELRNQTGHIIYYEIKGIDEPIPCDIDYIPKLHSHFRRPTVLVLRRIRRYLMGTHRRVLGRLEREQALERIMEVAAFDVSTKIRLALDEIKRYESMANMVRGGGRKLDILMQGLKVPSRARFELLLVDRILRDAHHPRHHEAMKWLEQSKFKGNRNAVHSLVNNGFQMLDNAANKLLDLMEDLSGLQFPRDSSSIDVHQNWYSLGKALPRGEDFVKSFSAEEQIEHKIKRLTYPMVRVGWDSERMRAHKDKLLVDITNAKIQAAQLSNLFFELEKKIASSTKPDGDVMVAISADFDNGMLSIREREDAEKWVKENKIRLQELMMEVYATLQDLKKDNPKIPLPPELEASIERVKSGHKTDFKELQKDFEGQLDKININDLIALIKQLEARVDNPDADVLAEICKVRAEIVKRIDTISIKNIDFHKKVRDAFQEFEEYENKVLELYKMEEQLEQMRIDIENWLVSAYRGISYVDVPQKTLSQCMEILVERMLLGVRKLELEIIDAQVFEKAFEDAMKLDGEDCTLHLDQLLQEINAIPRSDQLLNSLHDWEKDLGATKVKEKEQFVIENNDRLQAIAEKARSELRERLNEFNKPAFRRLRFEVFGLSDCLAENLKTLLNGLVATASRVVDVQEGEQLVKSIQSLEAQIIQSQKTTKPDGEASKKIAQMEKQNQLTPQLAKELRKELQQNFIELDEVLEMTSSALKEIKVLQNKFGAKKDVDYLEVTLNINDLDRLKDVYDFLDTVTMEDIKRFCVSYNLKSGLIANVFEKAKKKDLSVPKDIMQHFNAKAYKAFKERRYIALPLKTAMLKSSKEIFDAECQLLLHTLNLVNGLSIRKKATYMNIVTVLGQAKGADHQIIRALGLIWGRIQARLFKFQAVNHQKNFEGNRQALIMDIQEVSGGEFKR